jgi:hypothetical protein
MVPCEWVSEHFANQINMPLSAGGVCNFKEEAWAKLEWFEEWVAKVLQEDAILTCDEMGINIGENGYDCTMCQAKGYMDFPQSGEFLVPRLSAPGKRR